MSAIEKRVENYQAQVAELEALQSIYPDELTIIDHGLLADVNNFIAGVYIEISLPLEYILTISDPKGNWQLYVTLPADYPTVKPDVYVRSEAFDRLQQSDFNRILSKVTIDQETGQPCIYFLLSWVKENIEKYFESPKTIKKKVRKVPNKLDNKIETIFSRYWIYSHHILSKIKRRVIVEVAKENNISGFCMAGKPGIICIEGAAEECEDWWQKIKALNWQKILVKLKEDENLNNDDLDAHRKFSTFQEISFPTSECHNDMGELFKYLMEHDVQYVFKEYFGIEGKPSTI